MPNLCSSSLALGLNQDCVKALARVDKIVITTAGNTLTAANLGIKTELVVDIQQSLTATVNSLYDYENTTDDATVETTAFGEKIVTNIPPPSATVYLKMNPCDYNVVATEYIGEVYRIIPLLADGTIMAHISGTSAKGFSAKLYATPIGLPPKDNVSQYYKLQIFFTDIEEFKSYKVIKPTYNPLLILPAAVPVGYSLKENSNNGTTAVVAVEERCGDAVTTGIGTTTGNWEIVDQSGGLSISTVTDNADGTYDLAITMTAGQWATIRVKLTSGSDVTHISNNITLTQ